MATLWSIRARFYDSFDQLPGIHRVVRDERAALSALLAHCPQESQSVFDLGSGTGAVCDLCPPAWRVTGLDRSEAMLRRNFQKGEKKVIAGDGCMLPIRDHSFDGVICSGLTEYLQDKETLLREIRRVLKKGGWLVITTSPPGLITALRRCWGHRLYPVKDEEWIGLVENAGLKMKTTGQTLIQHQFLFSGVP